MSLQPGRNLLHYRLVDKIGEGVTGPGGVGFADGGRTLVVNRTTTESDIWLLALGE